MAAARCLVALAAAASLRAAASARTVVASASASAASASAAEGPCSADVAPFLAALFSSLGSDCRTWLSLFAKDASYYHQHDGFRSYAQLPQTCQGYAGFCGGDKCRFQQNGAPVVVPHEGKCAVLAPYLWSEIPASAANLEPHTGWEFIVLAPDAGSPAGYLMEHFAEIETSYSLPYNWAKPDDTPALVQDGLLKLLALKNSASKGECDAPLAPVLTRFLATVGKEGDTASLFRQQGDAVVLAAGGICQAAVPYAADVGGRLRTGRMVLTLKPGGGSYAVEDAVDFPGTG